MSDSVPPPVVANDPADGRTARRAVVGSLAAELGHDLQGPLNLFRSLTERLERGHSLDGEDAALMRAELDRLGSLTSRLRELSRYSLERAPCMPSDVVERALSLPPSLDAVDTGLSVDLEAGEARAIVCDRELVAVALRELVDNALEARRTQAGIRFERGASDCLCVWDDGPGFSREPGLLARAGVTTRAGAAGLGLGVALRAARAHGFVLSFTRAGAVTEVRVSFAATEGRRRTAEDPE